MSNYGSPTIIKKTLLFVISLIFIFGCYIFIDAVIEIINLRTNEFEYNLEEESEKLEKVEETVSTNFTAVIEDRFPSTGAPSVILIFGIATLFESILGITALNRQEIRLLRSFSIVLAIGLIIRFVFFFATICMYAFTVDHNPIRATTLVSAGIATIQVILIPCVCHFAKILKRGDPQPLQQIERLPDDQT